MGMFLDFFFIFLLQTTCIICGTLTVSVLQTKTDTFANSIDPDQMALSGPSHEDLHCLPFCFLVFDWHSSLQQ